MEPNYSKTMEARVVWRDSATGRTSMPRHRSPQVGDTQVNLINVDVSGSETTHPNMANQVAEPTQRSLSIVESGPVRPVTPDGKATEKKRDHMSVWVGDCYMTHQEAYDNPWNEAPSPRILFPPLPEETLSRTRGINGPRTVSPDPVGLSIL